MLNINRGGYSSVVLASHKTTQQKYAIKIIDKAELIGNEMLDARVRRECDINLQISHLNIAKVYEIYESPEDICLVMELYVSLSVFHLARREFPAEQQF